MLDRLDRWTRDLRRAVSRSRWVAGLHGASPRREPATAPGLLVVQIDGLSGARLRAAVAEGGMPFVTRLLGRGELTHVAVYSGMPSTTPAVQAELFYGVQGAVPGFGYVDRSDGRLVRMYQHRATADVEARCVAHGGTPLLAGGASYANVFGGGASSVHFCMPSLGPGDVLPHHRRWLTPLVAVAHAPDLARIAVRIARECLTAPRDLVAGLRSGEDRAHEVKFLLGRVLVGVVLAELCVLGASIDLARGLPVVHLNLLGYDEAAHRRGPDAAVARRALRADDRSIARLWRAAHRSGARAYDVWVVSDHGQEATEPWVAAHGEPVSDAVARVAAGLGLAGDPGPGGGPGSDGGGRARPGSAVDDGEGTHRVRLLGERVLGRIIPGVDTDDVRHGPGKLTVAASGPIGHVYLPRTCTPEELDTLADRLVHDADIPLVLRRSDTADTADSADTAPTAVAHRAAGRAVLPGDAATVLGADHPYGAAVAHDLVALCHHRDAGDLVISGWRTDGPPVSFPFEHGSHAGPGPGETDAFALVPPDTPGIATPGIATATSIPAVPFRPTDLRDAAFAVLAGRDRRTPATRPATGVRVMSWNVHACTGLDRRLDPGRIARTIARHAPDVVCLQELDVRRARSGHLDQAQAIADALGMDLTFNPTISVADECFGDAILSAHPMTVVHSGRLPGLDRPRLEPRGAIWARVDVTDRTGTHHAVQVMATHLSLHHRERAMAVAELLSPRWLGHPDARDATVLCGDLNALAWFPTVRRLRRRLVDAQLAVGDHRPQRTFAGRVPVWRIDHVLVDPRFRVRRVEVPDHALARVASDHRPLVVDLEPPPAWV